MLLALLGAMGRTVLTETKGGSRHIVLAIPSRMGGFFKNISNTFLNFNSAQILRTIKIELNSKRGVSESPSRREQGRV